MRIVSSPTFKSHLPSAFFTAITGAATLVLGIETLSTGVALGAFLSVSFAVVVTVLSGVGGGEVPSPTDPGDITVPPPLLFLFVFSALHLLV